MRDVFSALFAAICKGWIFSLAIILAMPNPVFALRQTGLEEQEIGGRSVGNKRALEEALTSVPTKPLAGLEEPEKESASGQPHGMTRRVMLRRTAAMVAASDRGVLTLLNESAPVAALPEVVDPKVVDPEPVLIEVLDGLRSFWEEDGDLSENTLFKKAVQMIPMLSNNHRMGLLSSLWLSEKSKLSELQKAFDREDPDNALDNILGGLQVSPEARQEILDDDLESLPEITGLHLEVGAVDARDLLKINTLIERLHKLAPEPSAVLTGRFLDHLLRVSRNETAEAEARLKEAREMGAPGFLQTDARSTVQWKIDQQKALEDLRSQPPIEQNRVLLRLLSKKRERTASTVLAFKKKLDILNRWFTAWNQKISESENQPEVDSKEKPNEGIGPEEGRSLPNVFKSDVSEERRQMIAFVNERAIREAVGVLKSTFPPDGPIPLTLLFEKQFNAQTLREAGFELGIAQILGRGIWDPEIRLPAGIFPDALLVHVQPGTSWSPEAEQHLNQAVQDGLIRLVDAESAQIVVAETDIRTDPLKQILLQVDRNSAGAITPGLLRHIEDLHQKHLIEAGGVIVLYRKGDLDEDVYLFA